MIVGGYMKVRIDDFRNKQVVSVKNGSVLGFVSDVEFDTESGKILSLVIPGRSRFFGLFGREDDTIIAWNEIEVIGSETVLVTSDVLSFPRNSKKGIFMFK